MEIKGESRIIFFRLIKKMLVVLMLNGLILLIFVFVCRIKSFQIPGFVISEETFLILSTPSILFIIAYNVAIAMGVSFVMRFMRNDLFRKSPFERLSIFLCSEITKFLAINVLRDFSHRKKYFDY